MSEISEIVEKTETALKKFVTERKPYMPTPRVTDYKSEMFEDIVLDITVKADNIGSKHMYDKKELEDFLLSELSDIASSVTVTQYDYNSAIVIYLKEGYERLSKYGKTHTVLY